jgi:hypothetical protein
MPWKYLLRIWQPIKYGWNSIKTLNDNSWRQNKKGTLVGPELQSPLAPAGATPHTSSYTKASGLPIPYLARAQLSSSSSCPAQVPYCCFIRANAMNTNRVQFCRSCSDSFTLLWVHSIYIALTLAARLIWRSRIAKTWPGLVELQFQAFQFQP